jgi:multiple sugar transport system permease protein
VYPITCEAILKRSTSHTALLYAAVAITCAFLVFPIFWLVVTALSQPDELRGFPPNFWPPVPRWGVFSKILLERPILLWLGNSTLAAIGAVALSMTVSILAGYSLSRFQVRGGQGFGLFILTAKMLPATLLVIPLFGIFRTVGLIGSIWSIVFAHATLIVPFSTWMLKGYFDTIPRELEQAAMVDGCSPLTALFRVILPVATPGLAATALYGFVLSWSDYAFARTFLTNAQDNWTANLGITTMKGEYISNWADISAASILVALPVLAIYLFLERYLVGGLTAGSDK